jgi:hypothetical protein
MVAAIANGAAFAKGRDFAAWLGLVPKQMSTGDRTILGHISKRGNRYLRTLFIQGARVILLRPTNWARHSFGPWLTAAAKRLNHNVLATALANKLARIAWTVLAKGATREASPVVAQRPGLRSKSERLAMLHPDQLDLALENWPRRSMRRGNGGSIAAHETAAPAETKCPLLQQADAGDR